MEVIPSDIGAHSAPRVIIVPLEQGGEPIFRNGMTSVLTESEPASASTHDMDVPVWADDLPSVSFDIKLGEEYESVGFDVDKFRALADEYGMDVQARKDVSINITSRKSRRYQGYYMPSKKEICIVNLKKDHKTNETFAHELKHAADDAEGILEVQPRRYIAGKLALAAANYITAGVITFDVASIFHQFPQAASYCVASAPVLNMSAAIIGYRLHPSERRAFGTKKQARDIITMTKRSDS